MKNIRKYQNEDFFHFIGEKQFSFEEFIPIVKSIAKEKDTGTLQDFVEAFKSFDREGMGYISLAEMRHMLTAMGKLDPRLTIAGTCS